MLNNQPIEKIVRDANALLQVHSIFHTIQGEGPFCGTPCVFVRLAGCNLQCPWCDTDYTSNRQEMSPNEILHDVKALWNKDRWNKPGLVVITGGEPFRQHLGGLFGVLTNAGFHIQVETNGTLPPSKEDRGNWVYNKDVDDRYGVYIVCSPKAGKVNQELADEACCFKYVLAHDSVREEDGLPLQALGHTANPHVARPPANWRRPIYLQPMDAKDPEENQRNIEATKQSCMRHGYILQLQIHKYIGVE